MPSEIHVVIAANRIDALARLKVLADGRDPEVLSAGPKTRVSFEDLADPDTGYDRSSDDNRLFCVVAKIED
jgi:hypothetical protein